MKRASSSPLAALGWMLLLLTLLVAAGGAAAAGESLRLGLPHPWVALAALALVVALARADFERGRLGLGLAPVLIALAWAPSSSAARAWSGPPLLALAAAVAIACVAAARPSWPSRLFVPVVLVTYAVVSLNVQRDVGAEGDEPHYLMVAESLLRDHDLALEADYAAGRYRDFYRAQPTLAPHYLVRGRGGEIYSQHALGLSLLVLPAYALGGYPAASLFMALLGALLAREIRALLRATLHEAHASLADGVAWAIALSPPLVHFAGLIFTEIPAALALALGLRWLREPRALSLRDAWLVGVVLAFVPWLNVRYAPFPLLLLAYALAARPPRRTAWALTVPLLVSLAASAVFHYQLYGFFDARRVYGRRPGFAWARLPSGLEALAFDQEYGLLVYAPLFVFALPGAWWLLRRRAQWRHAFALLTPVLVVLATAATWRMWWGGFTPPARFLVPVVPALAVLVGLGLRRGIGAPASLLIGWSLFLGLAAVPQPGLVHRDRDGSAPLLRAMSGAEEWTRLLPAFVLPDADPRRRQLALVWAVALGAALAGALVPRRRVAGATPLGLACVSVGALALAGAAARVSLHVSGGRDAVRLLGRPALELPGWRWLPRSDAVWDARALGWGPLYEAHRFPAGALVGARLPLAASGYKLTLSAESWPDSRPPACVVTRDKSAPIQAGARLVPSASGWTTSFEVPVGWPAVDLRLRAGGPLLLRAVRLEVQP